MWSLVTFDGIVSEKEVKKRPKRANYCKSLQLVAGDSNARGFQPAYMSFLFHACFLETGRLLQPCVGSQGRVREANNRAQTRVM